MTWCVKEEEERKRAEREDDVERQRRCVELSNMSQSVGDFSDVDINASVAGSTQVLYSKY